MEVDILTEKLFLTGKQKRFLRAMGTQLSSILQVGKGGVGDMVIQQAEDALEARELIKGRVLPNCPEEPKAVAEKVAAATESELVQVIGRNFLLYRPSRKKPVIELP